MSLLDKVRARGHAVIAKLPGRAGELVARANDALGRPLADDTELADRRAFAERTTPGTAPAAAAAPAAAEAAPAKVAAPVIVYHMDKTRRDAQRLTEILDAAKIPYSVLNIQEDAAAQMSVKRDSKGFRLPLVFIAGEAVGGRTELTNLATTGELAKKVFG